MIQASLVGRLTDQLRQAAEAEGGYLRIPGTEETTGDATLSPAPRGRPRGQSCAAAAPGVACAEGIAAVA
jgi:hypothetical protein